MSSLEQKLIESGEKDRLKELLRQRLREAGWHEALAQQCKQIIKEKGVKATTLDDLVKAITPLARKTVPDNVKKELMQQIKSFLSHQTGHDI